MKQPSQFQSRSALIVMLPLSPWARGEASSIIGGRSAAELRLQHITPSLMQPLETLAMAKYLIYHPTSIMVWSH